jgi:hypothetical protein
VLIAIAHIVGAIVVTFAFGFVVLAAAGWEAGRNQKYRLEEMAIAVGVSVEDLGRADLAPKLLEIASQRFTSDRFANRLSDLCGVVRTVWDGLGTLLQILILLAVLWFTFTDNLREAIYAWWIPVVAVIFWIIAVTFALLCRLLTGRYPGEAKQARKGLAEFLKTNRPSTTVS